MRAGLPANGAVMPPIIDGIAIVLALGGFSGVELLRNLLGALNPDIRRQLLVEHKRQLFRGDGGLRIEMRALPQGMHAGIRPPGADDAPLLARGPEKRGLQLSLDGGTVFLHLPARIVCALVFDD